MPAVTVPNLLVLPRVSSPAAEGSRPVARVTTAPSGFGARGSRSGARSRGSA